MIVRDEEPTMARCLESLEGLHDELIVVDTGSRDRTVEIASSFGARVEPFEWRDDFAAARNHACSLARGQWIVMVDGDEFLAPDGVGPRLAGLLRQVPEHVDKLLVENRTVAGGETVASVLVDRIFRNRPDLRWKYRIHEVIETTSARTAMTRDCYLHHEPARKRRPDLRVSEEREAMYLRALALDIRDHPSDPRPVFYLASTLYGAGRAAEALEAYARYFALTEGFEPERRAVAFRDASFAAGATGDGPRQRSLLFSSLMADWRAAETYLALADLALHDRNRDEAAHWLTIAADRVRPATATHRASAARVAEAWRRLADLHGEAGDGAAARACEERAEREERVHEARAADRARPGGAHDRSHTSRRKRSKHRR
jgi:tetratricopeptide (TPR) repeat protein